MNIKTDDALLKHLEQGNDMHMLCSSCKLLTDHVINLMNKEAHDEVLHYVSTLMEIYKTTSKPLVQTIIENIFIYHVGSHLIIQHRPLEQFFPECFIEVMKMQMIGSNI